MLWLKGPCRWTERQSENGDQNDEKQAQKRFQDFSPWMCRKRLTQHPPSLIPLQAYGLLPKTLAELLTGNPFSGKTNGAGGADALCDT